MSEIENKLRQIAGLLVEIADEMSAPTPHSTPFVAQLETAPKKKKEPVAVKKPAPEPVETVVMKCTECGVGVGEKERDLSLIRFRRVLCRPCFVAAPR